MKIKNIYFLAILALGVVGCTEVERTKEVRPNIIFILSDDQRDDSFSSMGHPWVKTPNIDGLVSKGVRFENAYIAEPTCAPSRAALLLGNHERVNRLGFSSTHKLNADQWAESYPVLFRQAGYKTGFVGKWHVNKEGLEFEEMFDFWEGHHGHGPFYFKEQDANGGEKLVTTNRFKTNSALKFLRTNADKPFCLSVCYATPHGSKVYSMHEKIDEPASLDERLKDHPIYGGKYRDLNISYPQQNPENPYDHIPQNVMHQDSGRAHLYRYDYEPITNKEHHFRYYQMITEIDQMVGEIVAELKKQGVDKKTVIVFGSDHGVLMGEYGMGGKGLLYDLSSKFPCFVYDPLAPENKSGTTSKELVSSLDITKTLLDYAGVEAAPYMTGRSLKPLIRGEALETPWREGLFLENIYTGRDTPFQEGYVDHGWKYIRHYKIPHPYGLDDVREVGKIPVFEMLFSLNDDPEEKHNLANDPTYQDKLQELREKCNRDVESLLTTSTAYANHMGFDGAH